MRIQRPHHHLQFIEFMGFVAGFLSCLHKNVIPANRGLKAATMFMGLFGSSMRSTSSSAKSIRGFSLLTWNVWFDRLEYEVRCKSIFDTCKQLKPDIIAFQEVLPNFVQALQREEWVQEYVAQSDKIGQSCRPYGVLILSRYPADCTVHPLPTHMSRTLVTASIPDLCGDAELPLVLGTVHLESLASQKKRAQQLKIAADVLAQKSSSALLVGDFNFCSERSWEEGSQLGREGRANNSPLENDVLLREMPQYDDLWPKLHPNEKGYTFDSVRNGVIQQYEQMRYDRVMAKLAGGWRAKSIELVGTDPIPGQEQYLRPSDHFGLFATFER